MAHESETFPRGLIIHERFRLGALRARGGMASIYEGTEIATDRHVAIKFLKRELLKNKDMVSMFRAEAEALEKLNHPNIIRGLGSGMFGGSHYIVMEFVSGATLRERLKWGRPERDETMAILRQAAAGLDHAHERGVIHRDIKPDNFMLDKNVVRIADFGIAQVGKKEPGSEGTETSGLGGTVIYSAPEQFSEGRSVDPTADVYSLGIMAYEMFTGQTPFTGYKPASSVNHQVPRAADAVLERAFHETPEERFSSAGAFVNALEAAVKAFAPDSTPSRSLELLTPPEPIKAVVGDRPEPPRREAPEPPGSRAPWLILVGVLLVVGVTLAWVFQLGPFAR